MKQKGFTMIELLVVIAIIGILAGTIISSSIRGTLQARDGRRIQELYQVAHGLQQYYTIYHQYPESNDSDDPDCNIHGLTWDAGNTVLNDPEGFIKPLVDEGLLNPPPEEWTGVTVRGESCIYRYKRVTNPCDGNCSGTYAILYAACESNQCPTGEWPSCCIGTSWDSGDNDSYNIAIFLKER